MTASLGSRAVRRRLVLVTALVWALLASPIPQSLYGAGILLTIVLAALDVVLGAATGWLAFARPSRIDEREGMLRDRAYRIAFRLMGGGIILLIICGTLAMVISLYQSAVQVPQAIDPRRLVALLELLVGMPTIVIAWLSPDGLDEPAPRSWPATALRWSPALIVPAIAAIWLTGVVALPDRLTTARVVPNPNLQVTGATCGQFSGSRDVARGFGGALRLDADVCWDGQKAWIFEEFRPMWASGRFDCRQAGESDFAFIHGPVCTSWIDSAGALHYLVQARLAPVPGAFAGRDLRIQLTVARDGRVLSFE
jgi:hypothetical protein